MKKIFFLLLAFFSAISIAAKILPIEKVHPYHVGSIEFKYNSHSKTFEISAKFFLDDLENALKAKFGKAVHFNDPKYETQINVFLKKILRRIFKIKGR